MSDNSAEISKNDPIELTNKDISNVSDDETLKIEDFTDSLKNEKQQSEIFAEEGKIERQILDELISNAKAEENIAEKDNFIDDDSITENSSSVKNFTDSPDQDDELNEFESVDKVDESVDNVEEQKIESVAENKSEISIPIIKKEEENIQSDDSDSKETKVSLDPKVHFDNSKKEDSSQDLTKSLKSITSNSKTENDQAKDKTTLDLSKTFLNGVKSEKSRQPLSENFVNSVSQTTKRNRSNSLTSVAEDLSLPAKRRSGSNDEEKIPAETNKISKTVVVDSIKEEKNSNDSMIDDCKDRISKQKIIRRLKQQLFNEEMKLLFLKKIRQSQRKENIYQKNAQHQNGTTTSTTNTINNTNNSNLNANSLSNLAMPTNLKDFNALFANNFQQSLQSIDSSGLNFSMNKTSGSSSSRQNSSANIHHNNNLVNNNVAHSNNHSTALNFKNHLANFNLPTNQQQIPMQAHVSHRSSSSGSSKVNSVLSNHPPYSSSFARSPYNYLNNPLSVAPPPPVHHNSSSNKHQRNHGYDQAYNLNTAHSNNHRSNTPITSNRMMAIPSPNLAHSSGYSETKQSSSKLNQSVNQSASLGSIQNQTNDSASKEQILLQKQIATLKQAMRKHMDKIPKPKFMMPEMHFIPNPSNLEFIYYVGLESVVDYLTGTNQSQQPPQPFECVQCGTDFTPVWKWKDRSDPKKPSVICERCVTKNLKKAIAEDYQKEVKSYSKTFEELEKHLASSSVGANTPPSTSVSPLTSQGPSNSNFPQPQQQSQPQRSSSTISSNNNLFGQSSNNSNNNALTNAALAAAAASANFGLQQAHTNSPLSSLSASQMASMANFLMPQPNLNNQISTPPVAHSGSSRSSSTNNNPTFNPNLNAPFGANNSAQSAATAFALLQQLQALPKITPAQSMLLAQQLLTGAPVPATTNPAASNAAAMAQLLSFPNILYSSIIAASLANQKSSNTVALPSALPQNSSLNAAAAAAGIHRQLLMEMLPNQSGNNSRGGGGGSGAGSSSSMVHQNWKS